MKIKKINKWFGLLGFAGLLSFVPKYNGDKNWFFIIFFSFFSYFLWEPIENQKHDERLQESITKAQQIISVYFILLVFGILFMLDRGINPTTILLLGSILFTLAFFIKPLLIIKFERE